MDVQLKTQKENEERVAEEYLSSLSDLNCNSKPLINMLTMLAEENIEYAAVIVKVVDQHIDKVSPDIKLPILYLIDSIVKNVKSTYVQLFSQCIVHIFCGVFEQVNEKIRERMYALRQTWNEVFSPQKLYALDVKVKRMDANWPITAKQPMQPSIHVNPNFLKNVNSAQAIPSDMEEILHAKTRELLELKKRKLELELEATKKHLEEQEKQLTKATESVIGPSVEPLLPPGTAEVRVGGELPGVAPRPQQMPGMTPPTNLHHQQHLMGNQHPTSIAMRPPGMYQQFRNPRPQQPHMAPPGTMNMPQAFPMNNTAGNKAKVHPVTPSLLNSVRQRDPRLARQQQQQQHTQIPAQAVRGLQITQQIPDNARKNDNSGSGKSNSNKSYVRNVGGTMGPGGGVGTTAAAGGFERKSPTRHTSSSNRGSSMGRSAGRSGKNSFRDKERDRKRNSAYTSQSNGGNGGPSSLDHRRKAIALSLAANQKPKCDDKDAFEIAPLSLAFKRKSSSPASSPNKVKDSKRSPKFRNAERNKNRSRSTSPERTSALKDIDLRVGQKTSPEKRMKLSSSISPKCETTDSNMEKERKLLSTTTAAAAVITKDLDKNVEDDILVAMTMLPDKDVDLRQLTVSSSATTAINRTIVVSSSQASANVATSSTSSPKVSFKIQKPFNILEKSTENLSTVTNNVPKDVVVAVAADVADTKQLKLEPKDENKTGSNSMRDQQPKSMEVLVEADEDDSKKRPSAVILDEEDLLPKKKIKQTKLDTLFGTEDVDLRTVPPQILAVQQSHVVPPIGGIMTPPPPPVISDDQKVPKLDVAKTLNNNSNVSLNLESESNNTVVNVAAPFKKSSLDDVRAKLAKAAKYNKIGKQEKSSKEAQQRLRLPDLNLNEDTLEANDDKIRTIISQAQELHDSGSINDEQYKNLVKTVMSLNETNKLKEAKRRESLLIAAKRERQENVDELDLTDVDINRMAARDAVLKKRIPKLPKDDVVVTTNKNMPTDTSPSPLSDLKTEINSPIYDDKSSDNQDKQLKSKHNKERQQQRNKQSKWGDRIVTQQHQEPTINSQPVNDANTAATWHLGGPFPKRPGFSSRVPHPPLPPLPNPSLGLPLPSPWQIGAGVVPPPFAPNQVPLIRSSVPPPPQPPVVALPPIPAPPVIPKPCNSIDNPQAGMVRSITIDGLTKEIRIYDKIAIVFMELDQPREIGFQAGQRAIIINNMEPLVLRFNDDFKPITIDGEVHQVRFGFPSRELYIDDHWYEIYFGGPAVSIPLQNKFHMLKAEGPPPQVNIGALRRDLVLGKINMIVNADIIIPIFLDGKLQTFRLNDVEHNIQFADNLLTVLLDGEVVPVEYGALPKRYTLGGTTYFIRFGTLPQGVVPGKVFVKDMIYKKLEPPVDPIPVDPTTAGPTPADPTAVAVPAAPIPEVKETETASYVEAAKSEAAGPTIPKIPQAALTNINIDELFQKLVSSGILGSATAVSPSVAAPLVETKPENVTINATTNAATEETIQPPQEVIIPIDLTKIETVKTRQAAIVNTLFSGMQCSSCGVRFPPEQTIKYSQHLDWHFRQNRRERDTTRKAHSRKWYYTLADWVQYEEIEDVEEREKNFDSQQSDMDTFDDNSSNQISTNSPVPSCPAGPEDVDRACDVCQEKFEQFYNEELEEWHMRCAVRVEDKIYHPLCYEDYKASLNPPEKPADETVEADTEIINADDDNATDAVIKIEADNSDEGDAKMSVTIPDDDDYDDDVIVLPNEEPSVTEIVDDDDDVNEYIPENVTREDKGTVSDGKNEDMPVAKESHDTTTESDVEIQEPNIPFTDLDTYEEKNLIESDETSQISFMNVKIKEEPKDDDDEDDGFEDVGTVVILPDDEISIHSSEGTPTHTIASPTSGPSPITVDLPASTTSQLEQTTIEVADAGDANISLDGTTNLEPEDDHNLSSAGPAPAVPVTSLVNKIKINITKNIISTNSSTTTATTTTTTSSLNSNELNSNISNSSTVAVPPPTAISTIPVLCGGTSTTTTANISSHSRSESPASTDNGGGSCISAISVIGSNMNVSNISVIGSYSSSSRYHHPASNNRQQQQTVTKTAHITPASKAKSAKVTEKVPSAEEVIDYKLKPALEKVKLKKTKKIECGVETSGLCSIM